MAIILIVVIVFLTLYIALAPIGECPNCVHCKYERLEKIRKQEELNKDYEHEQNLIIPEECGCDRCKERIRRRNSG